jgi:hypothetical protein
VLDVAQQIRAFVRVRSGVQEILHQRQAARRRRPEAVASRPKP